ncbi:hypothetical protein [Chondromyces apiculatus]|uniref:Type IV fimbrial assembly, ATPase PilB n=1 Tax=Chondromyces apiculatus DSM 436 TaxID=1192034 RepID=A0A017T8C8_9BACT|nr:hypothetical protein [Chondromyces apiculatus]EYF05232.1 Type IV fimbrial assembly, ATPase PilB [Chondromyces apiculatus DSM 436]
MSTPRIRLGQLLVDARMITQESLDAVLALQRTDGRRLGTLLVEKGYINEIQLTQILSHQLAVPWVSLLHIEFSRQLLDLVPTEVVERYCLVPIYVRRVRRQGDTLYVAMDDPTNEEALRECSTYSGLPVRAMIAPPSDIGDAIRAYYGASVHPPVPVAISDPPSTLPDLRDLARPSVEGPEIALGEEEDVDDLTAAELEEATSRQTLESLPSDDLLEASRTEPPAAAAEPPAPVVRRSRRAIEPDPETLPSSEDTQDAEPPPEPPAERPSTPDTIPATRRAGSAAALRPQVAALIGAVLGAPTSTRKAESEPGPEPQPEPQRDVEAAGMPAPPPSDPEVISPAEIPAPRGGGKRRRITLTLLDGTTITLPLRPRRDPQAQVQVQVQVVEEVPEPVVQREESAPPEEAPPPEEPVLTARDIVAALRAVSHGADANDVFGNEVRWEAMFAALLSLLLRKHVIADWEFVEELKKI